jgi:hypothetical protein
MARVLPTPGTPALAGTTGGGSLLMMEESIEVTMQARRGSIEAPPKYGGAAQDGR